MQRSASRIASFEATSIARSTPPRTLPFAHEDLAIVFGAYLIANHLMPAGVAMGVVTGAILASDFALYGIGAAARRVPWLQARAVDARVRSLGEALKRDLFGLTALCRFVPGLAFLAGLACGWTRVSLARFTMATICVSASYVVMMLYLVTGFGHALEDRMGVWSWPLLLALLVTAAFARQRILAFRGATAAWRGESIRLR